MPSKTKDEYIIEVSNLTKFYGKPYSSIVHHFPATAATALAAGASGTGSFGLGMTVGERADGGGISTGRFIDGKEIKTGIQPTPAD